MVAVTAAASALLQPALARPAVPCAVVAASRTGVHVATGDEDVPVLSVVAPGGAKLPGGCLLAPLHRHVDHGHLATSDVLDRLREADQLLVGDGAVEFDGISVVIRRWWGQPVVRLPDRPSQLREGGEALVASLKRSRRSLPEEVAVAADRLAGVVGADHPSATARAVYAMVGLGPGLTPAADDVLVGALLCWHHLALAGWLGVELIAAEVADPVRDHLDRTGAVSAALLHHAIRGCGVPEALRLLDTLRTPADLDAALDALALVGQHSGSAMAYGISIAVGAVLGGFDAERVAR